MKISMAELDAIAVNESQYPKEPLAEIAFAGRSNVGKSSVINSLVNRKNLARTSSKPGKTRTVNFYKINNKFRLVDLPGYGFARVSKKEKLKWGEIIEEYLNTREFLKEVVLVIDIRHKPTKDDIQMFNWIKYYGFGSFIIATKADKLTRNQINKNLNLIKETLNLETKDIIIPYSSTKKDNRLEVLERIEFLI